MTPRPESRPQIHHGGYTKKPNDLITAKEAVLLIDNRVSVLLAHWENERRRNRWWARVTRWFWRSVTGGSAE